MDKNELTQWDQFSARKKCNFHRKGEWDVTGIFVGMLDFIF